MATSFFWVPFPLVSDVRIGPMGGCLQKVDQNGAGMTSLIDPRPWTAGNVRPLDFDLEALRLAALKRFGVMDTPAEVDFDEISGLAAKLFQAPMALVSLVDSERQWFKSRIGLDLVQTPRGDSFCAHALGSDDVMVVQDALLDHRFRHNPLVTGPPGIRFYAGAPLVTSEGYRLGTLCVLDTVPRVPTTEQLHDLSLLSRQIMRVLELRVQAGALAVEVAARSAAEAALTQNQHLLDEVLGHTDVLIYAKSLEGRFLLANPALLQVMAPTGEQILGRTDHQLFPTEQADTYRRNDSVIAATGRRELFVEELIDRDGVVRTYRSTKFPLRGPDGEIYAVAGVSTDVTELEAVRSALAESEARWRSLVECSPVGVALVEQDGSVGYANPIALAIFGEAPAGRTTGPLTLDLLPLPGDPEPTVDLVSAAFEGVAVARRALLGRLDGSRVAVTVSAGRVVQDGRPVVQVILRDISAQVDAEEAVRRSERRFRSLFDNSAVAMTLTDEHGRWVEANPAFGTMIARDVSEVIGRRAEDFARAEDRPLIAATPQRQVDSADGVLRDEIGLLRPDGSIRWAWVSISATPGPRGEQWTLAVVQDVTERRAAETALRESEQDLAAIAAVARCVQSGADVRQVVVESVQTLADAATVTMLELLDDDTLEATTSVGLGTERLRVDLREASVTAEVWRTGQSLFLEDAAQHPLINASMMALEATVSAMWQPVAVDGEMVALINVAWRHPVAGLEDRAVRAVQVIAAEAAASLQAARLRVELERSASTDPLTGSLNRRAWNARLQELMDDAQGSGEGLAVAVLDLDRFKTFNDTFGHTAGDVLLRDYAAAALACVRESDLFARWGGEEFIVALPNCPTEQVEMVLNRLRRSVPFGQTCSVGYTRWDPDEPMTDCISRADAALYEAKRAGRDRVVAG